MDAGGRASADPERLAEAFAELIETIADEFDVHELLQVLANRCVDVLGVAASGLMLADGDAGLQVMVASNERAKLLELFQIQHDEGPGLDCQRSGETIVANGLEQGVTRWPRFATAAGDAGYSSVIALPMRVRGTVIGVLNLFGTPDQPAMGVPTARIARAMATVAAVAIEQVRLSRQRATLVEQLETALESRLAIEQAKGILAARLDISLDEAFVVLRDHARSSRRLLKDVAREAIRSGGGRLRHRPRVEVHLQAATAALCRRGRCRGFPLSVGLVVAARPCPRRRTARGGAWRFRTDRAARRPG
jgi:GAF domain-containing protein